MNRHQNKLEYLLADASTGTTKVMLTETDKAYIDINDDLSFLANKKQFVMTRRTDGFNHIYLYDLSGRLIRQISKGNWEVTNLYGIDE
jgi:dipeptidyl-peptidase-4